MIKRFIRRVLGLPANHMECVPREKHGLSRDALSPAASKVCTVLREAGFSAYVVGGAVRDLLLGIAPKDFDVATDARPEQVKPLFRRALIIGRRFRLVHVMLGAETVEVSTFRAADPDTAEKDEHGRVLRDNVFGSQEEDARRRDFSVNALYFDPASEEVVDFHGGLADLKKRMLRVIGDPETRYREGPVRMLRGVRLGAKLGLTLDAATREPIRRLAPLMERVPPARLFDEVLDTQCAKLAITRRLTATMREIWSMQPRFDQRSGQRPYRMVESPRYRMAYDFLAVRAASGEVPAELEAWWRAFHSADAGTRK